MVEPNPNSIKIISECFVRSDKEVESAQQPVYLSALDLLFLFIEPIQKGLLFPFPNDPTRPDIRTLIQRLELSLSIALVHFYPLAGQLEMIQYDDERACSVHLDCTKGPGARLIHATMDLAAPDILSSTDVHPAVRSFFDLGERTVNLDGLTKPLLTVQVTELLDGVFIGFTMNHTVVDGTSFIHFVSVLSEIFRSEDPYIKISRLPQYKTRTPDGSDPIIKFPVPHHELLKFVPRKNFPKLRDRIFRFSPESIAALKAKANEGSGSGDVISSYMALTGFVWKSMIRAQNPGTDEKTSCFFALNARTRLDPAISDDYFGNFLGNTKAVCKVDELLGQSLGWAARYLAQEIKKVNHEQISEMTKLLTHIISAGPMSSGDQTQLYGAPNYVVIGGSHRFDMYGPEFGLGRAASVLMGFANKEDRKVTANPGREGRGSVDLEISLRPHSMTALESDEEFMSYVNAA